MLRTVVLVCMKNKQISCSCQRPSYFISLRSASEFLTACAVSHNSGSRDLNCHHICLAKHWQALQEQIQCAEAGLLAPIKHFKHLSPALKTLCWHLLNSRSFAGLYVMGLAHPSFDNLFIACIPAMI